MPPGATLGRGSEDLTGEVLRGGFLTTDWREIRLTLARIMTWEGEVEAGGEGGRPFIGIISQVFQWL